MEIESSKRQRPGQEKKGPWPLCPLLGLLGCLALWACADSPGADRRNQESPLPAKDASLSGARWYGGDLHVHVSPPDPEGHSSWTVETVVRHARERGLDWLILTPHRGFREDLLLFRKYRLACRRLSAKSGGLLLIPSAEITTDSPGHYTELLYHPSTGRPALRVACHPFAGPPEGEEARSAIRGLPLGERLLRDRRWKPWVSDRPVRGAPVIDGIEVYNGMVALAESAIGAAAALRSAIGRAVPELEAWKPTERALAQWDRLISRTRRRIVGVAGSDSHGTPLKPLTFVQCATLDTEGLADGLREGRVCLLGLSGKDFRAESDIPGERAGIGGALRAKRRVTFTWSGQGEILLDGQSRGTHRDRFVLELSEGAFHAARLVQPKCWTNPIYVNLPQARRGAPGKR